MSSASVTLLLHAAIAAVLLTIQFGAGSGADIELPEGPVLEIAHADGDTMPEALPQRSRLASVPQPLPAGWQPATRPPAAVAPVEPIVLPELVSFEAEDGEQELFGEPWLPLAEEDEPSQTPLEDPPRKPGTKPAPRPVPKPAAVAIARTSAVPTDSPKPAYPKDARRHEAEGTAYIRASVSTSGTVTATALSKSSGHASLDEAARKAVARWKFRPATRGGQATATTVIVPVQFALR